MKKFAIFTALFAVILAAAFAALFSEGVQTRIANKILAENFSGSKVQSVKILPNCQNRKRRNRYRFGNAYI